mgnify:CR=1 FL=1
MHKRHQIKIDRALFQDLRLGRKTAEVRKDDRNYQVGDILIIYPFDKETGKPDGVDFVCREITHKLSGGQFGIEQGYCLLSIKKA